MHNLQSTMQKHSPSPIFSIFTKFSIVDARYKTQGSTVYVLKPKRLIKPGMDEISYVFHKLFQCAVT